jgi:hypothetical protein
MNQVEFKIRLELYQKGEWAKCFYLSCNNPAAYNRPESFCSHRCEALSNKENRLNAFHEWFKNNPEKQSAKSKKTWSNPKTRKKLSETQKERHQDLSIRKRQVKNTIATWTPEREKKYLQRMTVGHRKRIPEKSGTVYASTKGTYTSTKGITSNIIPYKNQWQLTAFRKIDENPLVISWSFLSHVIPYKNFETKLNAYIAMDLEIHYTDGSAKLVLIRPDGINLENEFRTLVPIEQYCQKNNFTFEVWTKEALT